MTEWTVHDQEGFARTYTEDDHLTIRRGDLRALLDVATGSMDYGSGFMDNEQVEVLRHTATTLNVDPNKVTPHNFVCQYRGHHRYKAERAYNEHAKYTHTDYCMDCQKRTRDTTPQPPPDIPSGAGNTSRTDAIAYYHRLGIKTWDTP